MALCVVDFAKFAGLDMPDGTPHLHAWHKRMSSAERRGPERKAASTGYGMDAANTSRPA